MAYVYFARPETFAGPSGRFTRVLISVGFSGHAYRLASASSSGLGGVWPPRPWNSATGHPLHRQRRFHDAHERAAAADVAVELVARLVARRVRIFFEQRHGRHHEAGCAEAAHQAVVIEKRLLHRVQRGAAGETVDGANLLALHF